MKFWCVGRTCLLTSIFSEEVGLQPIKTEHNQSKKSSKNKEGNLPWWLEGFIDSRRQNWLYKDRIPKQTKKSL